MELSFDAFPSHGAAGKERLKADRDGAVFVPRASTRAADRDASGGSIFAKKKPYGCILCLGSGLRKLDPQPDGRQFDHRQEIA